MNSLAVAPTRSEWDKVLLGDVADEITVGHVGPMASEYRSSGVPFLRSLNIDYLRINTDDLKFIDTAFHKRLSKSKLRPGDVVIVRTGKPGTCAVIPDTLPEANCSDLVIVHCGDAIDPHFLAYYVNSAAKGHVHAHLVGAVQQHFNVASARAIEIKLPSIEEQRSIVATLRALDDKIELNRQMSATLEGMARALFKSWLVDFDPVRAKAEGRDPDLPLEIVVLFPESFEDTELGEIPMGWRIENMGGVLGQLISGARPRGGALANGVPSIGAENVRGLGKYDFSKEKFIPREFFERLRQRGADIRPGDVLLYKDGAEIGRKSYFDCGFPHEECAVNEHVFILRARVPWLQRLMFFWLDQKWMTSEIRALNSNSAQPGINQGGVRSLPMLLPAEVVGQAFDRAIAPLTDRIFQCNLESRTLAAVRDTLLPKLISGEIRMNEVERLVEPAV